ncbi:pentapeptide repeat-containing protein [Saccharopolyspora karakumensis]|nr:pentapeptide repeat-containing protein [Saccharopolyspora karakumensis]
MTMRPNRHRPHPRTPTPPRITLGANIAALLVTAAALAALVGGMLWWGLGKPPIQAHTPWTAAQTFDFVKIVLAVVGGVGGVVALVVAYRKQRLGESAEQRENARLFAENLTAATEQLGSDQPAVRLAGMYALERLAQTADQQQTVASIFCAYLRMPHPAPSATNPKMRHQKSVGSGEDSANSNQSKALIETRMTAQRMLAAHLRPNDRSATKDTFWPDVDLDLTGAELDNLDFSQCHASSVIFNGASFHGTTRFDGAHFATGSFSESTFYGRADFTAAEFITDARFANARFRKSAVFADVHLHGGFTYSGANFSDHGLFANPRVRIHAAEDLRRDPPNGYVLVESSAEKNRLTNAHGKWGFLASTLN